MNTPEESTDSDKAKIALPPIMGNVEFKDLDFRFDFGKPTVLRNINLSVPAGTFVGVVGKSGSGKYLNEVIASTLFTRARQHIH